MPQAIPHAVPLIKSVPTCTFHLFIFHGPSSPCHQETPPHTRTLESSSGFLSLCDSCDLFELRSVTSPPPTPGFGDVTRSLSTLHCTEGTVVEPPAHHFTDVPQERWRSSASPHSGFR